MNQMCANTFDFEESISFIKKGLLLEILVNTFRLFWFFMLVNIIKFSSYYHRNFSSKKFLIAFMVLYSGEFN